MSHRGTNWAIQRRGLKPATKIVLWHLCDRHNPDFGCFPTQARLAEDAEMSISALNAHLARLEKMRLIHRVRSHDPRTHKRQATRYILGFEDGFPQEPTPKTGDGFTGTKREHDDDPAPDSAHGAISGFTPIPSPDFAQSHLRNPETNLVREPLTKPVKEEEDARARENFSDEFFGKLLRALGIDPDAALPAWWQGSTAKMHAQRWRDDFDLTEHQILEVAEETRNDHPAPPDGPKALDRAMERAAQRLRQPSESPQASRQGRGAQRGAVGPRASLSEQLVFYADLVNSGRFLPTNMIGNVMRDAMLAKGLVTTQQLRNRGVL